MNSDVQNAAAWVLRLALACEDGGVPAPDWDLVLDVAMAERCVGLCWARSGALLRRVAPPSTASTWRQWAFGQITRARESLTGLRTLLGQLERAGVPALVLKGLPLAQRLYGDYALRPSGDLDILVAGDDRGRAHHALLDAGWHHESGWFPREGAYYRNDYPASLEIHSSLPDYNLLDHLRLPFPKPENTMVDGVPTPTASGSVMAPYLAAHLAQHHMAPLLWYIDFATLWRSFDRPERAECYDVAKRARMHRYLAWGIERAHAVFDAARGNARGLRALGITGRGRRDVHNALRLAALAGNPADAARVLGSWIGQRAGDSGETSPATSRIAGKGVRDIVLKTAPYRKRSLRGHPASHPPRPAIAIVPPSASLRLTSPIRHVFESLAGTGATVWTNATGESMQPAIPHGAKVRLIPPSRSVRRGDVVLAVLPSGRSVLHRVFCHRGETVFLIGDACTHPDPPVSRSNVLARADLLAVEGACELVPKRRRGGSIQLRAIRTAREVRVLLRHLRA